MEFSLIEPDLDILKNRQFYKPGGFSRSYGETVNLNLNLKKN